MTKEQLRKQFIEMNDPQNEIYNTGQYIGVAYEFHTWAIDLDALDYTQTLELRKHHDKYLNMSFVNLYINGEIYEGVMLNEE